MKDLVAYRNVTLQEAKCFEQWPGLGGVDGDSRTLPRLCFYSRIPMTSQAMLALFPDMPEFHTCIVSLRTFWTLYNSTVRPVIMVNYCLCISYISYIQSYIIYVLYIYFRQKRNLSVHSIAYHVQCLTFWPPLTHILFTRPVFIKVANNKLHWNFFSGSPADTWGRMDRQMDVMKLIGVFRNYTPVPKKTFQFFLLISYSITEIYVLSDWNLVTFSK
jgi:hypothetical protein